MPTLIMFAVFVLMGSPQVPGNSTESREAVFEDREAVDQQGVLSDLALAGVCVESAANVHIKWVPATGEVWLRFEFDFVADYVRVVEGCAAVPHTEVVLPSSVDLTWWEIRESEMQRFNTYECSTNDREIAGLRVFVAVDVNNERVYFWRKAAV